MVKQVAGTMLPVFDRMASDPLVALYQQIYERVRAAIITGGLAPGARLPSSRTLANDLGVSRNTVEVAFSQLEAEGFLTRHVGAGSFVARSIPERESLPQRPRSGARLSAAKGEKASLSKRARLVVNSAVEAEPTSGRAFTPCVPSLDSFPFRTWHRLVARHSRSARQELLSHGEAAGYRPLREAVADYLATARGVRCDWRQVIILTSTQQALDLAARLLIDPGARVWMEEPGYLGARAAFQSAGAKLVPVPVDKNGLDVEAGVAKARTARLAYVTPSHQYPTGFTMSLARRLALLEWAAATNAWVIEDDYDSEFRYTGRPLAAMQGLDTGGRVVYTGTFNKVLFPALRLAYVVVPEDLIDAFIAARTLVDGYTPTFMQAVLADFIATGHFNSHIRRLRGLYQERREALLDAVAGELAGRIRIENSDTGLHVTGWLEAGAEDRAISRRAAGKGLDVPPLSRYYFGRRSHPGLLLSYACVPPKAIRQGIRTLATVL